MLFGLHIHTWPPGTAEFDSIGALAYWAEHSGFAFISASDHVQPFGVNATPSDPMPDPWILLTSAANSTTNLKLATLVSNTTLREPWHLAKASASLHLVSRGRFVLGLGSGGARQEASSFGLQALPAVHRIRRLEESIDVIRLLWSGNAVSYYGSHFQIDAPLVMPVPQPEIPILVGGKNSGTLKVAANQANLVNISLASPSEITHLLARLKRHCIEIYRDPNQIELTLLQRVIVRRKKADLEMVSSNAPPSLIGTPRSVATIVEQYARAGVTTIFAFFPNNDLLSMQLFAEEVIPAINGIGNQSR